MKVKFSFDSQSHWVYFLKSHETFQAYGVDRRSAGGGQSVYNHMIAKFSRMGSLPHFLIHGALLRALCARELH